MTSARHSTKSHNLHDDKTGVTTTSSIYPSLQRPLEKQLSPCFSLAIISKFSKANNPVCMVSWKRSLEMSSLLQREDWIWRVKRWRSLLEVSVNASSLETMSRL